MGKPLYIKDETAWPKNIFKKLNPKTGKDPVSIVRYDCNEGGWQAMYPFFGQETGLKTKLVKEGYVVYLQ